ncbi:esterase-like activity of phytase family protein [Altererythrobacter sp. MF3-039]|uniref:esterase-like activity of phytase family protein n=1 Tax=Altererythrobacter sp. MF3-039 TaxID=3252901 RepID=UPI00390C855B
MDHSAPVEVLQLSDLPEKIGRLEVVGAWELRSTNEHFGGFSALAALDDRTLLAASDRARRMELTLPLTTAIPSAKLGYFGPNPTRIKRLSDLESLAHDPGSGTLWATYENLNTLERVDFGGSRRTVTLSAMADWPSRSGAEASERLADGSFLIIGEAAERRGSPALLYPGDPLTSGNPASFRFSGLNGFSPTGATLLRDGRILVLVRRFRFGIPPRFDGALVIADPTEIAPGKILQGEVVARLESPFPMDNYEGIAAISESDGSQSIWLISDDNFMRWQRTLLIQLRWDEQPHEKARGVAARSWNFSDDRKPPRA